MSLNKFMHPRNRYKNSKPSFLHLALKYPEFRAHTTQDEKGKVFLDFKNADALRALTTCLLKEDFGLHVELPTDRLVPTLPLRLNYIHWLEDIVGTSENIWGIDVGTGASCIYPLLAAKMNKWHFLATEADPENVFYANKNVTISGFQDLIHVKQVSSEDVLIAPLQSFTVNTNFQFCMCNPPFFADHMEAQALTTTRSVDRPEANSLSTASPQECIAQGGEVGFIRQMIEESAVLRDRIRVYTSMVGKKSSLVPLKAELLHQKVAKFSTTEFCQGKTMRWGIAWTYDSSVTFPRSGFESRKEKPPLQYMVPNGAGGVEYKVHKIADYLKELMESIKVHCYQGKKAKSYTSITLTAVENTWCHLRRQRRQQQHKQNASIIIEDSESESKNSSDKITDSVSVSNTDNKTKGTASTGEDTASTDNNNLNKSDLKKGVSHINRKRLPESSINDTSESTKRARKVSEECEDDKKNEERNQDETIRDTQGQSSTLDCLIIENMTSAQESLQCSNSKKSNQVANDISKEEGNPNQVVNDISKEEGNPNQVVNDISKEEGNPNQVVNDISKEEGNPNQVVNDISKEEGNPNQVVNDISKEDETVIDSSPKEYILKCVMRLKLVDGKVQLELEWLDGQSRELMHQVMTFIKNKLTQSKK